MFRQIKRSARIGASYASTLGQLAALEAKQETERFTQRLRQQVIAIVVLLFAVLWLHIGVVALIWDSPMRHWLPFAIAGGLLLVAAMVWWSARALKRRPVFEASRDALSEDMQLWQVDLIPEHVLHPHRFAEAGDSHSDAASSLSSASASASVPAAAEPPSVEQLQRELALLRVALHASVVGSRQRGERPPEGERARGAEASAFGGFEPRSRTMRTLVGLLGDRGDGMMQQVPVRALLAVGAALLMRRGARLRWLMAAWPALRLGLAVMAARRDDQTGRERRQQGASERGNDRRNASTPHASTPHAAAPDSYAPGDRMSGAAMPGASGTAAPMPGAGAPGPAGPTGPDRRSLPPDDANATAAPRL